MQMISAIGTRLSKSLLLSLTLSTVAGAAAPVERFASNRTGIVLAAKAGQGAVELIESSECHQTLARAALVELRWTLAAERNSQGVRVDISKLREGFETDTYLSTRQLSSNARTVAVEAPEPGVDYYWRILDKMNDAWVTSEVARFTVPVCPWDQPNEFGSPAPVPVKGLNPTSTKGPHS